MMVTTWSNSQIIEETKSNGLAFILDNYDLFIVGECRVVSLSK